MTLAEVHAWAIGAEAVAKAQKRRTAAARFELMRESARERMRTVFDRYPQLLKKRNNGT